MSIWTPSIRTASTRVPELQEVAVGDDEVRDLARREAAEVLLDAEDPRRVVRDRAQRLLRRQPERGRGRRLEREVALVVDVVVEDRDRDTGPREHGRVRERRVVRIETARRQGDHGTDGDGNPRRAMRSAIFQPSAAP
jgi:hypothetical protein